MRKRELERLHRRVYSLYMISADAVKTSADLVDALNGHIELKDMLDKITRLKKEIPAVLKDARRAARLLEQARL